MSLIQKTSISLNNIGVPGFTKDGLFLGEQPIETNTLIRTSGFTNNQSKSFVLDNYSLIPVIAYFVDSAVTPSYKFDIVTPNGLNWSLTADSGKITSYAGCKTFLFPFQVIDKGSTITITASQVNTGLFLFGRAGYIEDVKLF